MSPRPRPLTDPHHRGALAVGVALGAVFLVLSLAGRAGGNWGIIADHLVFHGWVMVWLMLVGFALRSFGTLDVMRFWLLGYFVVPLFVLAIGEPTEAWLGADRELQVALVVPVLEETAKLLPLVGYLVLLRPRSTLPSVTDGVVASFAVGAGFAFREDLGRERIAADGFDASFWGLAFPSTLYEGARFIVAHGGWTILAGVGIGLIAIHRRRWAYVVAIAGWGLAVLDHAAVNALGSARDELDALLLDGKLVAGALIAAVVLALLHDAVVLRRAGRLDDRFRSWQFGDERSPRTVLTGLRRRRLLVGARLHAWSDLGRGRERDRSDVVERLSTL